MKNIFRTFKRGKKGFTLIELLVVVAILGILAAVVIPNVMGMMGTGRVESANTEDHDVAIAILAAMVDQDVFDLDTATNGDTVGDTEDIVVGSSTVKAYFTGTLEADYTVDDDGKITGATAHTDGKWDGLTYTVNVGWSE